MLDTATQGLRLHPGDDALARLELGFALHGPDQLFVVQVTVAEVESDQGVAHELAFPHRAGVDVRQVRQQQREQAASLAVHASPGDGLLQRDLGPLRLVSGRDELFDLVGRRAGDSIQLLLGSGARGQDHQNDEGRQ